VKGPNAAKDVKGRRKIYFFWAFDKKISGRLCTVSKEGKRLREEIKSEIANSQVVNGRGLCDRRIAIRQ